MKSLSDHDGRRCSENAFVGDEAGGSEVGGGADAFEDGGEGHEGLHVGVGEVVGAGAYRSSACGSDGGGEESDMGLLIFDDEEELLKEAFAKAGILEIGFAEFEESFFIKNVLKVLEL